MTPQEVRDYLAAEPVFARIGVINYDCVYYGDIYVICGEFTIGSERELKVSMNLFELKVELFTILPKSYLDVRHVRNFIVNIVRNKGFQVNIITEQTPSGDMEIEIAHAAGPLRFTLCDKYMYSGDIRIKYKKIDTAESHLKLCGTLDPNTEFGQQMLDLRTHVEEYKARYPANSKTKPIRYIQNESRIDSIDYPDYKNVLFKAEFFKDFEKESASRLSRIRTYKKIKREIKALLPQPIAEEIIPQIGLRFIES